MDFGDLPLTVLLDEVICNLLVSTELRSIDLVHVSLTLLQASTNLVWKPSRDWGSSCCSWVFSVVNDILSNHAPMLMSESKSRVHVLKHQESRSGVLKREFFHSSLILSLTEGVDVLLVMVRSVFSQIKKILCERVSWII